MHLHPRKGPSVNRSLPPPSAHGHGLGTASLQSPDATMDTWVSDAAPREYAGRGDEPPNRPTVSVAICAYLEDRWSQLKKSVASVEAQTSPPIEIIVCIDHNEELLRRCEEYFVKGRSPAAMPLIVLANKYDGRLGSARNTAADSASGEVLAFLDDDAAAAAD